MTIDMAQYNDFFQQGQDAVRKTVETWTRTVKTAAAQLPAFTTQFDAEAAIDRYFDVNEKFLEAQRDFAKRLVGYATAAGAAVQETVEKASTEPQA
jgi:acetyl-CoA carboxylase carboxyltransferase component